VSTMLRDGKAIGIIERVNPQRREINVMKKLAEQSVDNLEKFMSSVVSTMLRKGYWNH